jgi:cysteine desulfurase
LQGVAFSTGSACASHDARPSHVLTALGFSEHEAKSTFRIGFGRMTTEAEVLEAAQIFAGAVRQARWGF